jgi:hypothetical protein
MEKQLLKHILLLFEEWVRSVPHIQDVWGTNRFIRWIEKQHKEGNINKIIGEENGKKQIKKRSGSIRSDVKSS